LSEKVLRGSWGREAESRRGMFSGVRGGSWGYRRVEGLSGGTVYRSGSCDKSGSRVKGVSERIVSIGGCEARSREEGFQGCGAVPRGIAGWRGLSEGVSGVAERFLWVVSRKG
jgi:hypothetical protein